jgi:hypothetical protein
MLRPRRSRHSSRRSLLNLRLLMLNSLKRFIVVRLHCPLQAVVPAPTNKKRAPQKPSKQKTLCSLLHQLRKLLLLLRATQTGLHLGKLHKHTSLDKTRQRPPQSIPPTLLFRSSTSIINDSTLLSLPPALPPLAFAPSSCFCSASLPSTAL